MNGADAVYLLGHPLAHSLSPLIHSVFSGYEYRLMDADENEADAFIRSGGFRALNVTVPYKRFVIPYLDEVRGAAEMIGSVNTVVNEGGRLVGYNTDAAGLEKTLRCSGIDPAGKKTLILGSGGTSLTAGYVLKRLGASQVVTVSRKGPVTYEKMYAEHSDAELIVNTTPVGMWPRTEERICFLSRFPALMGAVDVIYNPRETVFLREAKELGIPRAGGLKMLVTQAAESRRLFGFGETDAETAAEAEKAAAEYLEEHFGGKCQ